ncbi:MAG TPA: helix-turn-helix domain-containing protein [Nitrososphaerales archaeon]|nr:helix-turn-helix domain-containing protein [Nitrososphaerales archaeon]
MIEAVLECPQPHGWIRLAAERYGASIEILDSKILPGGIVEHLFELQVDPGSTEDLMKLIEGDRDVIDVDFMKSNAGQVYGSVSSKRCTVCKQVAKSKCFLSSLVIGTQGQPHWTVLGGKDSYKELVDGLEKSKIPYHLRLLKELHEGELLTSRQEEILSIAFESGYFDFPKRIGLKGLALRTGVKESTLAEILRRGQRKIVHDYLERKTHRAKQD